MTTGTRHRTLVRAIEVYGDTLMVNPEPRTVDTLQGITETGYCVCGRSYGGDLLTCVYQTKVDAQAAITAAESEAIP